MKKNIITFIVLIGIIAGVVYAGTYIFDFGKDMATVAGLQDANTNMLLVQAKVQSIKEQAILNNDESVYKGDKLETAEIDVATNLINAGVISIDDPNYGKFYIWNNDILAELELDIQLPENEYYIVNYETLEVITTAGVVEPEMNETKYVLNDVVNIVEKTTTSNNNNNN